MGKTRIQIRKEEGEEEGKMHFMGIGGKNGERSPSLR